MYHFILSTIHLKHLSMSVWYPVRDTMLNLPLLPTVWLCYKRGEIPESASTASTDCHGAGEWHPVQQTEVMPCLNKHNWQLILSGCSGMLEVLNKVEELPSHPILFTLFPVPFSWRGSCPSVNRYFNSYKTLHFWSAITCQNHKHDKWRLIGHWRKQDICRTHRTQNGWRLRVCAIASLELRTLG
jgi:hypothetical protein